MINTKVGVIQGEKRTQKRNRSRKTATEVTVKMKQQVNRPTKGCENEKEYCFPGREESAHKDEARGSMIHLRSGINVNVSESGVCRKK